VAPPPGLHVIRREPIGTAAVDGRRVVLVHGTMDRASSFTRLMAKLPEWSIIAYDRRGYADSASVGVSDRLEDHVADLLAVLDGHPAVVLGHSFGGVVVLAAAARAPGLIPSAVVWEPPQPWTPGWPPSSPTGGGDGGSEAGGASGAGGAGGSGADGVDRSGGGGSGGLDPGDRAEWFMRRALGDRIWERLPASTRAQRRAEGKALEADFASLRTGEPPVDPAAVHVPVVVGRGGRSPAHHRRATRELAHALRRGRLVEIAEAGHGAHLSHPLEVAGLLRSAAPG
jgi:lipase